MKNLASHKVGKYLLPKPHLSWSQIDLVERDPMGYAESYIHGQPRYESEAMMFGKHFARAMETGKADDDDSAGVKFLVDIGMPRLELVEHRIEVTLAGVPFVLILDTTSEDLRKFREYKTGMAEWNQTRVDTHGQLIIYGMGVYLSKGFMPECHLDWVRTHYDPIHGDLTATGELMTFKRKPFSLIEFGSMSKRITRAAQKITELMRASK